MSAEYYPLQPVEEVQKLYADRLRTVFSLYEEAGVDARLVGSLGRLASTRKPFTNFQSDDEGFRDIDITVLNPTPESVALTEQAKELTLPINLDVHFSEQIVYRSDYASISYKEAKQEVDPHVLAPFEGELLGVSVPTFDPKTHFHFSALKGPMRPKDFRNSRGYIREAEAKSSLPEESFTPFHNLNRERRQRYRIDQMMGDIRWQYHKKIPYGVRKRISVVTQPLFHAIVRK